MPADPVTTPQTADPSGAREDAPRVGVARVTTARDLLAVAVQLFNEQGYDATSVADLAKRLGLTKSALYHHFSSKEELLAVALEAALGGLEAVLDEPGAREGAASDRLRFVLGGDRRARRAAPRGDLLLRVRGNSAVEQAALERRRVFDHRVTSLVAEAQAEGSVRDDVDAAVAARLLFGMINSVVEWYRPGGGVDGGDRLGADIVRIALDGLRTA